jgi:hypothetical protein
VREKRYLKTLAVKQGRDPYESMIVRPYFHVQPLDATELTVWCSPRRRSCARTR